MLAVACFAWPCVPAGTAAATAAAASALAAVTSCLFSGESNSTVVAVETAVAGESTSVIAVEIAVAGECTSSAIAVEIAVGIAAGTAIDDEATAAGFARAAVAMGL